MVASEHCHMVWVPQLVREQQRHHLHIIRVSVHVVSLEQILFVRGRTNLIEKSE